MPDVSDSILTFWDGGSAWLLRLDRGAPAERNYIGRWKVCDNPLCACTNIDFFGLPGPATDPAGNEVVGNATPVTSFSLDVMKRTFDRAKDEDGRNLGMQAARQLGPEDWMALTQLLYDAKARQIREADLDSLQVRFPEDTVKSGIMVGYAEIFPLASGFPIEVDGSNYLADDMYCVQPGCNCRQAVLTFLPADMDGNARPRRPPVIRYGFRSGLTAVLEEAGPGLPAVLQLVQTLEQAHPKLSRELVFRHKQLSTLFLKRHGSGASSGPEKVGRNAPCPCGSGNKFKKCCGRKPG